MRNVLGCAVALLVVVGSGCARWAREPNYGSLSFDPRPFDFEHNIELFEVSNGMRVALIKDDTTNVATVDLRFDVGAAEDPDGRVGMAHLVEHMLFQLRATPGGPTFGDELEQLTLSHNAFTSWDYTHYTAALPVENLEAVIALEGRRMRATCDQIDEATLQREIDVVRQEERQRHTDLTPVMHGLLAEVFGARHPYSRPIGSDDVAAVTRDELCAFVERHYAPDRAYLVVTGDFTTDALRGVIGRTFGPMMRKGGPRAPAPAARLTGRETRHAAPVEHPTALVFLPYPAWGDDIVVVWDIARAAVASEMGRADEARSWITATEVHVMGGERQRVMVVAVEVTTAGHLAAAADEVFTRIGELETPYSDSSMYQLVSGMTLDYIQGWDQRLGRGEWVARFMHHTNHNWFMLKELKSLYTADLDKALPLIAKKLVRVHSHVAYLTPSGKATSTLAGAVPSTTHEVAPWRAAVDPAEADRPVEIAGTAAGAAIERYTLGNGLDVQLAPDRDSQIVDVRLVFPAGSAHEPPDRPYLAFATAHMLTPDFEAFHDRKSATRLQWALERQAVRGVEVDETAITFSTRGAATWGDWHLWQLSWWLADGVYNESTLRATRRAAEELAKLEKGEGVIRRPIAERLFGVDHPYGTPPPLGSSLLRIGPGHMYKWKSDHFRARGATLIVSGGFDPAVMKKHIDELFGGWDGGTRPSLPEVRRTQPAEEPSWFAIDDPEAVQTGVWIAYPTRSDADGDEASRDVLEAMIEDELRDIREGMGATYSMNVMYLGGAAGGALLVGADVEESRAPEAADRMIAVLDRFARDSGGHREAFVRARKKVLGLALARLGGASAVASQLAEAAVRGHSPQRAQLMATRLGGLKPAEVARVAEADLDPGRRIVIIKGKPAAVDAVFARIGAEPTMRLGDEEKAEEEEEAAEEPTETAKEAEKPTATEPGEPKTRGEAQLYLGKDHMQVNHQDGALYLDQRKLTLDEFLAIAGADEVRSRMRMRRWGKRGMIVGGLLAIVAGTVMNVAAEPCPLDRPIDMRECEDARSGQKSKGAILAGVGVLSLLMSSQLGKGAPSEQELRGLARRYNGRPVAVTPVAVPGGGGIVVSGRF